LKYLKEKFVGLRYKITNGYLTQLDFTNFTKKLTGWKLRTQLLNFDELKSIKYLRKIKELGIFPPERFIQNEIILKNQIQMLKSISKTQSSHFKLIIKSLFSQLTSDFRIKSLINQLGNYFDSDLINLVGSDKAIEIIINIIIMCYLKNKYNKMKIKIERGLVKEISLKNYKLVKIPETIRELNYIENLTLKSCQIYNIPSFINKLSNLKRINLSNNMIEKMPKFLEELENLTHLDLSFSEMIVLHHIFTGFQGGIDEKDRYQG
jgi:hypothetical protein